jgi:hypothetical protein
MGEGAIRALIVVLLSNLAALLVIQDIRSFLSFQHTLGANETLFPEAHIHKGPPLDLLDAQDKVMATCTFVLLVLINFTSWLFMYIEGWKFREAEQWYIASISAIGIDVFFFLFVFLNICIMIGWLTMSN